MRDGQDKAAGGSAPLVLIIDDAEDLRIAVVNLLQIYGFRVVTAKNGFEGVRMAVESPPDIILMDLAMPGMDGLETARLLKGNSVTSAIPIVAFTGQTVIPDPARLRAKGFAELISKPDDPEQLVATLRRILDQEPGNSEAR